ncbi:MULTISPECIES: YchJ family protein [unclassified Psychrobacter]|uniref:YchJ family protein n=1 Tax=unclassified Psychrobacter TaxID=196806 RepID=UPI0025B5DB26|nr:MULTISPECIES: YchJ family protein [unclassified Psychrobacter]MDN3453344.1 YchJ family protein [Psychrobacter sp. APC 3350]MDN3501846.1 YchJ family protein [Psychrobacter sp. 5A.1]
MHPAMPICPCQVNPDSDTVMSPVAYQDCCQPYHDALYDDDVDKVDGIKAETAERLMRTRYSAFVLIKPEYIVKTTLPAQQSLLDVTAIESWAKETDWAGLEIVEHTPKLGKRHAQVEFKAYFNTKDNTASLEEKVQAHHELSAFVKVTNKANHDARWYFLDPTVAMTVTQKQPCICGSGEKFKRCCAGYN